MLCNRHISDRPFGPILLVVRSQQVLREEIRMEGGGPWTFRKHPWLEDKPNQIVSLVRTGKIPRRLAYQEPKLTP
jgi:hypothetical protein